MKKGWKIFWIITSCMAGVGLVLCGVSVALGLTFSDIEERFPDGIGLMRRSTDVSEKRYSYPHDDSGDHAHSYDDITALELKITGCNVYIEESDDNRFHVDTDGVDFGNSGIEVNVSEDTGKLTVETVKNGTPWTKITGTKYYGDLYIYLPEGRRLDVAELDFGAGDISANNIAADTLNVNIGAGDFEIYDFSADEVTVNIGAGELEMTGEFESDFNLKCGAGSADIYLRGSRHEYNYSLKCGLGEVDIDGEEYGGLANTRTVDNGGSRQMDIVCGAGEVSVEFGY